MTLARAETSADKADGCSSVVASVGGVLEQWKAHENERLSLNIIGEDTGTPVPKSMLETAVRNLVDNAMRYSPRDAAIEVGVFLDPNAQRCVVTVSDRGPGLTAEQASQIGQRFWRGDQGRKSKDGAGLGISIVRAIAERFGGALNLEPREGGGLVAKFLVPTDPAPKKSQAWPAGRSLDSKP